MDVHLLDNTTLGWEPYTHASIDQQIGNAWHPTADGYVNGLRYRRDASEPNPWPDYLTLWRMVDGVKMAEVQLGVDPGGASDGWKDFALGNSVRVYSGVGYVVAAHFPTGHGRFQGLYSGAGTPPTGLAWTTPVFRYANSAGNSYPTTTDPSYVNGVDVAWDTTASHTPSTGIPGVTGDLADWLDTVTGSQANSAPLLDHATLGTVNTKVGDIDARTVDWAFGLGSAAHGYFNDVKALIAAVKTVTDTLPTPVARLTSIVLDHYADDIELILAQIDSVLSGLGSQSAELAGTAGSAIGALSGRTGFPATGWTLADEADFTDAINFAVPADAYVLTITSWVDAQSANSSPAGTWLPRLGWWCVMNGSLATQRQFVDFAELLLDDGGRRMAGCAIELRGGTVAHVQAWLLA